MKPSRSLSNAEQADQERWKTSKHYAAGPVDLPDSAMEHEDKTSRERGHDVQRNFGGLVVALLVALLVALVRGSANPEQWTKGRLPISKAKSSSVK